MSDGWPATNIEMREVSSLKELETNARIHSDSQVEKLANLITKFGWTQPILIDEDSVILAGHGRLLAAKHLDLKEVPVMVARGWSEAEKRAYAIADNKIYEFGSWDQGILGSETLEITDMGFDIVDLDIGLSVFEGELVDNPLGEWAGMPEYESKDKTAFRSLQIHFHDQEGVDKFAELTGQPITKKTRYLWFPEIKIDRYADKAYEDDGNEEE